MSATATAKPQRFDSLRNWIAGAGNVSKEAATLPELDDGGKPATQGSRSSENASDVKKVAPHVGVETAPDNPETGSSDKPVPESGLMQTTVGKMPEVERAVKVVTEENEKVSALKLDTMDDLNLAIASLEKSASALGLIATAAAASGAAGAVNQPAAQPAPAATQTPKSAAATTVAAAQPPQNNITFEQQQLVASYAKFGADQAMFLGEFLRGQADTRQYLEKWAAEGGLEEAEEAGGGAGGPPAAAADPMAAAGGGGDQAPDAAPPAPGGAAPGGDGGGGGAPSPEELASACAEMGVGPDELMQAAQIMQQMVSGGAGASVPPADKAAAEKEVQLMTKLASETKDFVRSGKFRLKPAADGTPERARREVARSYIDEMLRFAGK